MCLNQKVNMIVVSLCMHTHLCTFMYHTHVYIHACCVFMHSHIYMCTYMHTVYVHVHTPTNVTCKSEINGIAIFL